MYKTSIWKLVPEEILNASIEQHATQGAASASISKRISLTYFPNKHNVRDNDTNKLEKTAYYKSEMYSKKRPQ